MLAIKEKRRREFGELPEAYLEAKGSEKWHLDPAGCFIIELTDDKIRNGKLYQGKIIARNDNNAIAGLTAKEILDTIIGLDLFRALTMLLIWGENL